ncbi:MAG TPA: hypothetical protein VN253_15180 [Kofleriaceae bacterium]|nr:hypothetical protein [Kofleriaceae bacterium]
MSPEDSLLLYATRLSSPGFWDFVAKLNPLEVIRHYLSDRHERRKDKNYRERAEQHRLELENSLLANKVIRERIELAKSLGASEVDLIPLLNQLVHQPLRGLGRHQDNGLIEAAELVRLEIPEKTET